MPAELADRVVDLGGPLDFPALLDALVTDADGGATLIAIGNIHGQGEVLLERLDDAAHRRGRAAPRTGSRRSAAPPSPAGSPSSTAHGASAATGQLARADPLPSADAQRSAAAAPTRCPASAHRAHSRDA